MALRLYQVLRRKHPRAVVTRRSRYASTKIRGLGAQLDHRLIMSVLLGRQLLPTEYVHHLDRNRWNNHPRNLQVLGAGAHTSLTLQRRPFPNWCPGCGRPFRPRSRAIRSQQWCSRACYRTARRLQRHALGAYVADPITLASLRPEAARCP